MTAHVAIIGGGISGLSALEHLTRVAPSLQVTLLEASPRLGGHIRTERSGEFLMEAGPDVLLAAKPAAVELARRVGLGERLHGTNPRVKGSYILSGTRLRRMPDGMTGLVPSQFGPFVTTPLISPFGKLRVGLEYFIPPRRGEVDESIEQFVVRRLGREMYERLVEPLLSGISAGDGAKLSMQAMFPQLRAYEREYGGLAKGMLAAKRRSAAAAAAAAAPRAAEPGAPRPLMGFVSLPGGLGELVEGVQHEVRRREPAGTRVAIRTGARVERVERVEGTGGDTSRYVITLGNGDQITVDAVIFATPGYVSAAALRPVDEELSGLLRGIEYASTVTISVAYPASAVPRPLDATGYVVPRIQQRSVLACTWVSSKFEGRSPAGHPLFRLFLGGAGRGSFVERTDDELLAVVRHEMREVMGITVDPELMRVNRFDRAMPQYNVGHLDRVARIEAQAARNPGLALAGAASGGVGIPDCVRSGERAARTVLEVLARRYPTEFGSTT
ncbi:MAG TPA: protoporphyrinogen oxidase [Gemmatimonadaceae bacterium]|nr:protoporphyrinogen oxidase [Gemmatimonadaceae bacterium]